MKTYIDSKTQLIWQFDDDIEDVFSLPSTPTSLVPHVDYEASEEHQLAVKANQAKAKRDELLASTDWMVTRAAEQGVPLDENVAKYRQELRDLPKQKKFPTLISWPTLKVS